MTSSPASSPAGFIPEIAVDNTLGAWLIGTFSSVFLTGITYLQAYQYWRAFQKDPRHLKAWVGIVVILETWTAILVMHASYYYVVTLFWDPVFVFTSPPVWSAQLLPLGGVSPVRTYMGSAV
ncbi:hypothetical protein BD309DRAFT_974029, partial [Dichomitus squalens]